MRDLLTKVLTGSMIAGAALMVSACGSKEEANNMETANVTEMNATDMNTTTDNKLEKAIITAEQVFADLQRKRATAAARQEEIATTRKRLGFAVHASNEKEARAQLNQLNSEDATLAGEVQSLDGALIEAEQRLTYAKQAVGRDQERQRIIELQNLNAELKKYGPFLDKAANDLASALRGMIKNTLNQGLSHPATRTHRHAAALPQCDLFRLATGVPRAARLSRRPRPRQLRHLQTSHRWLGCRQ